MKTQHVHITKTVTRTCPVCEGSGSINSKYNKGQGIYINIVCPLCDGVGKYTYIYNEEK